MSCRPLESIPVEPEDSRPCEYETSPTNKPNLAPSHHSSSSVTLLNPVWTEPDLTPTGRDFEHTPPKVCREIDQFSGWQFGVVSVSVLLSVVLILNLVFLIWAAASFKVQGGIGTLQSGSCQETETLSTWIHLAINILGTGMLSGSNYCMQRLSAPSRADIDRAHQRRHCLDIGIPSVRNLRHINRSRTAIWIVFACSSLPLHLFYNSVVFSQITAVTYNAFIVDPSFLTSAAFDAVNVTGDSIFANAAADELNWLRNASDNLGRLDPQECVNVYASEVLTNRGDVLLVTSPSKTVINRSVWGDFTYGASSANPFDWICDDLPGVYGTKYTPTKALVNGVWTMKGQVVDHCLNETMQEKCDLQFSVMIMMVVVLCNSIKLLAILTMRKMRDPTLVTVGDAIASFLERKDIFTEDICLASKQSIQAGRWTMAQQPPQQWRPQRRFWFAAVGLRRWIICNILCAIGIVGAGILLRDGLSFGEIPGDGSLASLWQLGFGTVSPQTLVQGGGLAQTGLIGSTLLANLPQLVLSLLYFAYNAIITSQVVAQEWNESGRRRKPLRVTQPQGQQTSTYYLGLSYQYGEPLLALSVLLHWLYSRSIFLINISFLDYRGRSNADIHKIDFSPTASNQIEVWRVNV